MGCKDAYGAPFIFDVRVKRGQFYQRKEIPSGHQTFRQKVKIFGKGLCDLL